MLISAPTGSGKTLAGFLASLDQRFREGLSDTLPDETGVLYLSPLKTHSNDIHKNLEQPLAAIRESLRGAGREVALSMSANSQAPRRKPRQCRIDGACGAIARG